MSPGEDLLGDVRVALWRLLAELREGEVSVECAEQQISAYDSLIDLARAEREAAASPKAPGGQQEASEGFRESR